MHEVRVGRVEAALVAADVEAVRQALAAVSDAEIADHASSGAAICSLARAWLALREDRPGDVRAHLRRATGEPVDQFAGPYAAQRIFGPALDIAAGLALAEGDPARAVTLLHAATAVLTLRGTVPERTRVRWARAVGRDAAVLLPPDAYAEAAGRGERMRLADALGYAELPLPVTPDRPPRP
jgi:hypothetical protein